jgi:hypothetical protein
MTNPTATKEAPAMRAITATPTITALPIGTRYDTREGWLKAAVAALAPIFAEAGVEALPTVQVSVGWPGGKGQKNNVIGQCWHKSAAKDGVAHIFISPVLDDRVRVLDVLAHELIHALDENKSSHRGRFVKVAKAIGLAGKPTATVAGPELADRLARIAETLGVYPHGAMSDAPRTTGKGRMVKVWCDDCGLIMYTTRKWIDTYGAFPCPCGGVVDSDHEGDG